MKKMFLFLIAAFGMLTVASAQTTKIFVQYPDSKKASVAIEDYAKLSFRNGKMVLLSPSGAETTFSLNDLTAIRLIDINDPLKIELMENTGDKQVSFNSANLMLKGFGNDKNNIKVYSISGKELFATSSSDASISIPNLSRGCYLIKVNQYVFKVMKP